MTVLAESAESAVNSLTEGGIIRVVTDNEPTEYPVEEFKGFVHEIDTHDMGDGTIRVQLSDEPPTLEEVKARKLAEIDEYDGSQAVNLFYISGMPMWLDHDMRTRLMRRFDAERAAGLTDTVLWYGDGKFDMTLDKAVWLLNSIEVYACQCFDVTAAHKAAVSALGTVEEVQAYDITKGYPEKLVL